MLAVVVLGSDSADAAITMSGIIDPDYDGSDPWILGRELLVGRIITGSLTIDTGSDVINTDGFLGFVKSASGTVTVSGSGSTWSNTGSLYAGFNGDGTLNINDGGVISNVDGYLGFGRDGNLTSDGVASVSGTGSQWNNSGKLFVGGIGTGILNIENNAIVNVTQDTRIGSNLRKSGSIVFNNGTLTTGGLLGAPDELLGTGTINTTGLVTDGALAFDSENGLQQQIILSGLPGQNITINLDATGPVNAGSMGAGFRDFGTLTIADSRTVSSYNGYLGFSNGSNGTANVTGAGSTWNITNTFYVGLSGAGTLNIEGGAVVNNAIGRVGPQSSPTGTATATVSGPGSAWNSSGDLYVGDRSQGMLTVQNGGTVTSNNVSIGERNTGTATITDVGSMWIIRDALNVGVQGTGTLNINTGSTMRVHNGVTLATSSSGIGLLNLSGGTLDLNGTNLVKGDGAALFKFTGGMLKNAGTIDLQRLFIHAGGVLSPGELIGVTDIVGNYQLNTGTIEIELGGDGNVHDLLTVSGNIFITNLGATLDLSPLGPMSAGTYTIIESINGTINGEFKYVTGLGEYPGLVDVQYGSNAVTVTLNQDYVPEPGTASLLSLLLLGCLRRRG
jgi:fibronectin-binding autotransporter adhesin